MPFKTSKDTFQGLYVFQDHSRPLEIRPFYPNKNLNYNKMIIKNIKEQLVNKIKKIPKMTEKMSARKTEKAIEKKNEKTTEKVSEKTTEKVSEKKHIKSPRHRKKKHVSWSVPLKISYRI